MSRTLPPLDLHAHVATGVAPEALEELGAVVFAVTRSLDEFNDVLRRQDAVTVWGVGCHPGVPTAQDNYDETVFSRHLEKAAFVGEVGLDGSSRVPLNRQIDILSSVLVAATRSPRIVSIHSATATRQVLDIIEMTKVRSPVLHWWRGSTVETRRALELGCFFSVNQQMDVSRLRRDGVPLSSLLPETDHPNGNRRGELPRQPGRTLDVERSIAATYEVEPEEIRNVLWATFSHLVSSTGVKPLLPVVVQKMLAFADSV